MDVEESSSYNALNLAYFSDYKKLKKIFEECGSWSASWAKLKNAADINKELEWEKLNQEGIKLILQTDKDFPGNLKEIPWSPHGLYTKGAPLSDKGLNIAIVGTRKSSLHGKSTAKNFSRKLSENGFTIVSGLALGIDSAAHVGTLEAQGRTIAVLANGLDNVYPRQNRHIAEKILENNGTIISEYPIHAPSLPQRFIERNRIISGLSIGSIIIEAPKNSGAMATARFALEQNREIFVIPGPFDNPNFEGSHELIKTGAALVTSISDILANLGLEKIIEQKQQDKKRGEIEKLDEKQKSVILSLQGTGQMLNIDEIANLSNLEIPELNSILSLLVIKNLVKEENGKYHI